MTMPFYGPVERAVKDWLMTTSLPPLLTRADGGVSLYMAMPIGAPIPVVTVMLVGGGPRAGADLPDCRYRLSFDVYGTSRDEASLIARTLVSELENLGGANAGVNVDGVCLGSAEVLNVMWRPDPDSDTARYIVDALITTVL